MNNLPAKFKWLQDVPELPKVVAEGLSYLGVTEIVGAINSPIIMGWSKALGLDKIFQNDETAWCGLFHAWVLTRSGKFIPFKSYDLLRAKSYAKFGVAVKEPMLGDTLVFGREGGGHVGTYVAESTKTYFVLGGNQSNRVSITEIAKDRLIAARRPVYQKQPAGVKRYIISSSGQLSTNEA